MNDVISSSIDKMDCDQGYLGVVCVKEVTFKLRFQTRWNRPCRAVEAARLVTVKFLGWNHLIMFQTLEEVGGL